MNDSVLPVLAVAAMLMFVGGCGVADAVTAYRCRQWDAPADIPYIGISLILIALGCAIASQALASVPPPDLLIQ